MTLTALRNFVFLSLIPAISACSTTNPAEIVGRFGDPGHYGEVQEGHIVIPAIDAQYTKKPNRRETVAYFGDEAPGTIVVDPHAKFLYFVEAPGSAVRYPIAVGRQGRGFQGQATVGRKAEWPSWTPTANMIRTEPEYYGPFAQGIPGGRASPLGARALYLFRGDRDTYYRIHGTNEPAIIGNAGSAGCIRLFNQDIIDLYERTSLGATVFVRTYEQSVAAEGFEMANRGGEIAPSLANPEQIYAFVAEEERRRLEYEALQ